MPKWAAPVFTEGSKSWGRDAARAKGFGLAGLSVVGRECAGKRSRWRASQGGLLVQTRRGAEVTGRGGGRSPDGNRS